MLNSKHIDKIIISIVFISILIVLAFINGESFGIKKSTSNPPYASRLFNDKIVHELDIQVDKEIWESLLKNAKDKEYVCVDVTIDNEDFYNVGLRVKGNNSLTQIQKYGSKRFGFKIEFDHFDKNLTYHGLDKVSLNSSFQDNSFLKEYMTYKMMAHLEVPSSLCSYVFITVNGEDWGLYVAIEEVENAFAKRNFGIDYGQLYKPDYRRLKDENNDVSLIYTGNDFANYDNIFRKARFKPSDEDKRRLIKSLEILSVGEDLEKAIDIDNLLRYFTVQSFVANFDSYLGQTGHNYFLYEKDGMLTMIPWDYNLAYGTYALGMTDPVNDPTLFVNLPIDSPALGDILDKRPMFTNVMAKPAYKEKYHEIYEGFITEFFDSGYFVKETAKTAKMISPYVMKDPTKFCSHEDFLLAVDTFQEFCLLRAKSVSGQLRGDIPSCFSQPGYTRENYVDASHISINDLGDFEDMRNLKLMYPDME
jgi:hypothetical protein